MPRAILALIALLSLSACGVTVMAPAEEVARRAYVHDGPPRLTLYTVINNRTDGGAHTALLINGSQRVLWDPAGSFKHPHAPEQADVLFGITPNVKLVYEDYHARETYRIVEQHIDVTPEVAERALQLARAQGAAGRSTCSITTSRILSRLPGFESFPTSFFPKSTMRAFAALPGVVTRTITDDDANDNHGVLIRAREDAAAGAG